MPEDEFKIAVESFRTFEKKVTLPHFEFTNTSFEKETQKNASVGIVQLIFFFRRR